VDYIIILAGGKGRRFWPLSREALPKQFLGIIGKESLLSGCVRRAKKIVAADKIIIASNRRYRKELYKQLKGLGIPRENIILEPRGLNTLPATAAAVCLLSRKDPAANFLVLPSDHYVRPDNLFIRDMRRLLNLGRRGYLALIGIKADKPITGYGYLKEGRQIASGAFRVRGFREKPNLKEAKQLLRQKGIYWNAGIFSFQARALMEEIKRQQPLLYRQIIRIKSKSDISRVWPKIKPVSIDYGIGENCQNPAMVKADFSWSDLGSWEALCELLPQRHRVANRMHLGSKNTFVHCAAPGKFVATVGVEDLVIVDTPDALLVCKKGKSQEVRKIAESLKRMKGRCV
jgi:mannose-1-phosphate guanylyltransferase/mannose-6-phosphate isomerase